MGSKRRRTKSPYFDQIEPKLGEGDGEDDEPGKKHANEILLLSSSSSSKAITSKRITRSRRSSNIDTVKQSINGDVKSSDISVAGKVNGDSDGSCDVKRKPRKDLGGEDNSLITLPSSRKRVKGKAPYDDKDGPDLVTGNTSKRTVRSRAGKNSKQKDYVDSLSLSTSASVESEHANSSDVKSTSSSKAKRGKKEVKSKQKDIKSEVTINVINQDSLLNQPSTSKGITRAKRNKIKQSSSDDKDGSNQGDDDDDNSNEGGKNNDNDDSDSDEDADDWEEVEEAKLDDEDKEEALANYKPQLPEQGVQITIDGPKIFNKKRRKKQVNVDEILRQQLNRMKKELQLEMHKTHLLCLLSRGFYLNRLTSHPLISSLALSYLTDFTFDLPKVNLLFVRDFSSWFRSWFTLDKKTRSRVDLIKSLTEAFSTRTVHSQVEYVLLMLAFLRVYSPKIQLRLCYAFNPVPIKPDDLIMTEKQRGMKKETNDETESDPSSDRKKSKDSKPKPASYKLYGEPSNKKNSKSTNEKVSRRGQKRKKSSDTEDEDYDIETDEEDEPKKGKVKGKEKAKAKPRTKATKKPNKGAKPMISEDDDDLIVMEAVKEKDLLEYWCEIYVDTEEKWVCLEVESGKWDEPGDIEKRSHSPLLYVVSWDNYSFVKDVSQRYCSDFASSKFRRSRIDDDWWTETLSCFRPRKRTRQEKKEDEELDQIFADRPMPTNLSDFKNHPLYVLKKHLLKYEVIYPPDAPPLGNFRGEPVFARECVKDVHSREYWMRQARVVRPGEEPYKMSIKRKKWDRNLGDFLRDLPLELFGEWQTDPYIPPEAKDGKVPRNQYGNVELFQPCMLPKGTVYLQLPGLIRIANKLKIDCAPAVVGFDNCSGGAGVHPVFEGFVVCSEFEDILKAAWEEEQMNIKKREIERREKRIYGNWKRLIRGVLIREQLKLKYNRDEQAEDGKDKKAETKCPLSMEDIDRALSMFHKKRRGSTVPKQKQAKATKKTDTKSSKRRSRKRKDSSEDEEDEEDDEDDFIVEDDEEDEIEIKDEEEEEEAETELESSDSD